MGTTSALAYADYALFLSGIALLIISTHAISLRQAGRRDRRWSLLAVAAVVFVLAHGPEIMFTAGVSVAVALVMWPALLVLVWYALVRFLSVGKGFVSRAVPRPRRAVAVALGGGVLVAAGAPFGLASEIAAVLVSVALLGVADSIRHLADDSSHAATSANRTALALALFGIAYAPSVILAQAGLPGVAMAFVVVRVLAGFLAASSFGVYAERVAQSAIPDAYRRSFSVARVMVVSLFAVTLVMGLVVTEAAGRLGVSRILDRLDADAGVAAAAIDGEEVAALEGKVLDLDTRSYGVVQSALTRILVAERGVTYAYLMRDINHQTIIIAEGIPIDDEPDLPGTVYFEASPELSMALKTYEPFREGPLEDKWGNWYSSFAPVIDADTGESVALLGLDMDVAVVNAERAEYRLVGLMLAMAISLLVHGFFTVLQMTRTASSLLAGSDRRFRRVFDSAPEAILVLDADTLDVLDANPFCEELLGYTHEQLVSLCIEDVCEHEGTSAPLRELVENGMDARVDRTSVFLGEDGSRIEVEVTGVPIDYEGSSALMLFARDVGERRAAERMLEFQAEFNALITDISRSFINVTSESVDEQISRALGRIGRFAEVDRAYVFDFDDADHMTNTYEWHEEGIPGRKTAFRRVPTAMYPSLTSRLMGGRDVYVHDTRISTQLTQEERTALEAAGIKSLLVVPMTVSGYTVGFMGFDSIRSTKAWSTETIALLSIVADIVATAQARTQAESELRKLSKAIEQSPVAVIITDAEGAIEYVNPKFTQLNGYELEEAVGQNPRILKSGLTPEEVYKDLWDTVLQGGEWSGQLVNKRKDGEQYWASATISAMRRRNGTISHFVAVQEDVTLQREAEESLREAKTQAESANRAKSEFLATMSHEIRTPMNAIIGMAELLHDTELSVQQARYIEIFQRAGESLLELINSVLDLSKIEADKLDLERVPFDVREIAEMAGSVVGMRAGDKGIELLYRVTPDVPARVVGDPARLRQVLMNLLGNALKFTDQGQVLLTISRDPDRANPGHLLFSVADTGIGIPDDKLDTIFESFTQADSSTTRKFGGTGLGLTISKRIVELMGGRMWVESTEGDGTTFLFSVPFEVAEDTAIEPAGECGMSLAGLRTLVIDDNATNRLIVSEMVAGWGIDTVEAFDAPQGLELALSASEEGRPFDIIVLDHQMPGMDGFQFLEALRADRRVASSAVVMLSSDAHGRDSARARRLGLLDYLLKPVRRGELREALCLAATSSWSPPGAGVSEVAEVTAPLASADEPAEDSPSYRILVAEDTEDNRFLIRHYFSKTPHVVQEAVDGQEALDAVMGAAEPFDLVLMDMQMPVMDGYEATRRIRAWEAEQGLSPVCVVALTAYAMQEEIDRSLNAGCDGHLTKPIKKRTLLDAVDEYAKGVTTDVS